MSISIGRNQDGMLKDADDIQKLILRAKAYDREAFGDLYRLSVTPVHKYISTRLSTIEEAEELTQEVFMAALSGIQSLRADNEAALLAWLFQIARHKLADHLRQRYRRPTTPIGDDVEVEASQTRPDEAAEQEEDRSELRHAFEQLTDEQREVVIYKYVLGYDNEKTANLVGKNANSVNQLHHRALASLHRLLTRGKTSR